MSKLTLAHHTIGRATARHLHEIAASENANIDDFEINAGIRHYHRQDRYRQVTVTGKHPAVLEEIKAKVLAIGLTLDGVTVDAEISGSARSPDETILDFSIWPKRN